MVRITDVIVVDWEFSTNRECTVCGEEPVDYWQMAKVKIRYPGIIPFTEIFTELLGMDVGKWICLECLGNIICDIYDKSLVVR